MQMSNGYDAFRRAYEAGHAQILSTRLVADLETPVSAMLKLARDARYSFLLESVEGGAVRGRYSIIGLRPDLIFRIDGNRAAINRHALADPDGPFEPSPLPPLEALRALLKESRIALPADAPPMAAGVFGYMGYDMVRLMEELPPANPDVIGLPDGMLIRPTVMAIFDSVKDDVTVVTPVYPDAKVTAKAAYARAEERLSEIVDALDRPLDHGLKGQADAPAIDNPRSNTSPEDYMAKVGKAKDYIAAGDIFQVVLSQRFETEFTLPPFALYRSLRRVNPSPFLYYLDFDRFAIIG
ncbi:MAG: chorismate-binding protein, partial [Parvibaculaceae bacterium]